MKKIFFLVFLLSSVCVISGFRLHHDFFTENPGWIHYKTRHFTIHHEHNAKEETLKHLGQWLESAYSEYVKLYCIRDSEIKLPLHIYIYKSREYKKLITNDNSLVHYRTTNLSIHTVAYETTHYIPRYLVAKILFLRSYGYSKNHLPSEGTSMNFQGEYESVENDIWAAWSLSENRMPYISEFFPERLYEKTSSSVTALPLSGSFTGFVIKTYGKDRFKSLISFHYNGGLARGFLVLYSLSLEEIEEAWHDYLSKLSISEEQKSKIKNALHKNYAPHNCDYDCTD